MEFNMTTIADNLIKARGRCNINTSELSRRTRIARSTLCFWEAGGGCPSLLQAVKIAKALDTTVSALVEGVDEEGE